MLAGQRALYASTARGKIMGAGELHLHDWFVPVIYQEQQDPQLITQLPPEAVQQLRGEAGPNQIANAHIGMAQNLGATGATAVTHILVRD